MRNGKTRSAVASLFLSIIVLSSAAKADDAKFELKKGSIGRISVNDPISTTQKAYSQNQIKKSTIELEGETDDTLEIRLEPKSKQPDLVVRKNGIIVHSPKFKTASGLGVGSTVADIRKIYKVNSFVIDEGCNCIVIDELKMSFSLKDSEAVEKARGDLKKVPVSTPVVSIWVH